MTASLTLLLLLLLLPAVLATPDTTLPSLLRGRDTDLCSSSSRPGEQEGSSGTRRREEPTMADSWRVRGAVSSTGGSGRQEMEGCSQELARLRCWGRMG